MTCQLNTFIIAEDVEIILLKARLEQTEKTLERLIGKNILVVLCLGFTFKNNISAAALNSLTTFYFIILSNILARKEANL